MSGNPDRPWWAPLLVSLALIGLIGGGLAFWQKRGSPGTGTLADPRSGRSPTFHQGEELARKVCVACHLFPEPASLDKVSWAMEVLPAMALRMGQTEANYEDYLGGDRLKAARIFPTAPALNAEEWRAVCSYYLEAAPAQATDQPPHEPIKPDLPQFEVVAPSFRRPAATSLVKIDEVSRLVLIGDADAKTLGQFSPDGKALAEVPLESPVVNVELRTNGLALTLIGRYPPSDELLGKVVRLEPAPAGPPQAREILANLPRPAHATFADLNQDGREDVIVSGYGNFLGRFSWHENLGEGRYAEHVLIDRAGAIRAYVHDFNRDGRPDLMVMLAAGREGIYLLLNQGKGEFALLPVVEQHPAWGYSYFELADFNGDGFPVVLATNGDNGDYAKSVAPLKAYHGVRIYLNDGKNNFYEAWFYPLHGAYRALARDFNGDGRLDVAAISFFPDYRNNPLESFVYFENAGGLNFTPHSFPGSITGAWLTMDAGDVDGDGDIDLVLGAYNHGPNHIPHQLFEQWQKSGPAFLVLKNRKVSKKP
jgi:hypothetical protein